MLSKRRKMVSALALCAISASISTLLRSRTTKTKHKRRGNQPGWRRIALLRPIASTKTTPWRQLLSCGTSSDYLIALNFDGHTFHSILLPSFTRFRATVNYGSPYRRRPKLRGRRCSIITVDILGLVLWYLKSSGRLYSLCPVFGLVQTSVFVWVDFGLEVLRRVISSRSIPELHVGWPDFQGIMESAELLHANRPYGNALTGVFGVVDGGRLPCSDYIDNNIQNAYYEGYTTSVEVTNLLVFNFRGELIHAAVNYPGSWHDSKVAWQSGLITKYLSDERTPPGNAILGDSAFVADTSITNGKIVRGRKANEGTAVPENPHLAAIDLIMQRVLPSERQAAEWGVRALKAPFGCLRLPLSPDSRRRGRLITICVHMLNLRTRCIGLNQIRTVYASSSTDVQPWIRRLLEEQGHAFSQNQD